jgi:hypothetical protein
MAAATPHDALIGAGKSLVDTQMLAACDTPPATAVHAYISANSAHLAAARAALAAVCRVPLRYDASCCGEHCEALSRLRNLTQSFALEFQQAAADGDHSTAARLGVDLLDLANAIRRRGRVSEWLRLTVLVSLPRYDQAAAQTARKPSFPVSQRPVQWFRRSWECLHIWWWPWSSKPRQATPQSPFPTVFPFSRTRLLVVCLSSPATEPQRAGRVAYG